MDHEEMTRKIMEHDSLLAKQYENIKTLFRTTEQQGKLLDTVHTLGEVQVGILTEMKYIRSDLGRVEKCQENFKEEIAQNLNETKEIIEVKIKDVKGDLQGVSSEVECIKGKPAKRYEKIVDKLIDTLIPLIIGGLIGYFANVL